MAVLNVYSPEGNGIVIKEEDLQKWLDKGYIPQEQFLAEQKAIAEEKYQEWLNSPDTVEERFRLLRQVCESKLAATDYLMNSDYPITEESKEAIIQYREAIRNINRLEGAPWDGGGGLTPFPELPEVEKVR